MSKRRNRSKSRHGQSQRNGHGQPASARFVVGPEGAVTDTAKTRVNAGAEPTPEPDPMPADAGGDYQAGSGYDASAGNAVQHGRRSTTIFPESMATLIDFRFRQYVLDEKPQTSLQSWVVYELARATVQLDVTRNLLLKDLRRILDRANSDTEWSADAEVRCDRLAARLPKDPYTVARALERTTQGVSFLLYNYKHLADAIQDNGELTAVQRDLLFDLRAVPHAHRTGTREVPAGTDKAGLAALVERETRRLELKQSTVLNTRDRIEQVMAQDGVFKYKDSVTRGLKSDESRARRRVDWALDMLEQLKAGASPATLIDNETNEPLDPDAKAPAATRVKSAPAATTAPSSPPPPQQPASPPPDKEDTPPASPPPDLPEFAKNYPVEVQESMMLLAAMIRELKAEEPPSDPPPPSS